MKERIKNTLIVVGIGALSLLFSLIYMWVYPYLIEYFFAIILLTDKEVLAYLLPSPYVVLIASWLYGSGVYLCKDRLLKIAEVIFGLSMIVGIVVSIYRWIVF